MPIRATEFLGFQSVETTNLMRKSGRRRKNGNWISFCWVGHNGKLTMLMGLCDQRDAKVQQRTLAVFAMHVKKSAGMNL